MAKDHLPWLGGHHPMCQVLNVDPWDMLNNFCFHAQAQNSFRLSSSMANGHLPYVKCLMLILLRQYGANIRLATSQSIKMDQKIRTDLGLNNFTYSAAKHWNDTTILVRNSPTLAKFKLNAKGWVKENVPIH